MSRRALSWLLIELTPTASPTNPDLNENLEIGARFLRTGLLHEEFRAVYRSRRHIGAGIVAFGRGGEGSEEDGKAMVEKAVRLNPFPFRDLTSLLTRVEWNAGLASTLGARGEGVPESHG